MRRLALAVVATVVFTGTSRADVFYYTDSGAFVAALGSTPSFTETYEGPIVDSTIANGGSLNGLTYTFAGPSTWANFPVAGAPIGRIDGIYNGFGLQSLSAYRDPVTFGNLGETPNLSQFYPGESFTVTPTNSSSLYALGVFINANEGVTQAGDYFIQTSVGTAYNGATPVLGDGGPNPTMYFMGLISTTPFTSATIGSLSTTQPDTDFFRYFFNADNLTFATQSPFLVPEPATLAVFGLMAGIGGLAYPRRRTTTPVV